MSPAGRPGPVEALPSLRKGWCPGALRPMAAADGLVVRLRPTGGILSAQAARALAPLAARHGNGNLDLTARANLQLRGVTEASLPALVDALRGLGLVDADPAAEAIRNVIASPLAGLHQNSDVPGPDIRPLVAALEARLAGSPALHALPGKFGFLVDDGGAPSLAGVAADVRFDWTGETFAIGLGGPRATAVPLGRCTAAHVVDCAEAVARGALTLFAATPDAVRMRTLIEIHGAAAVIDACDAGRRLLPVCPDAFDSPRRHTHAGRIPLALMPPWGRLAAGQLDLAAALAAAGSGELRLTPWRSLLLPGVSDPLARERARSAGFIVDDGDPRRKVAACVGAPECARATTATREDAAALADLAAGLGEGVALHISGCAKGCAHTAAAPATLVGRNGRYDLVLGGRAGDGPVLRDLDRSAVRAALAALLPS